MRSSDDGGNGPRDGVIMVRCRFFATFAELVGRETFDLELAEPATVADAVQVLRGRLDRGGQLPAVPMTAVNREHATSERRLEHGDELALLPPLAGG